MKKPEAQRRDDEAIGLIIRELRRLAIKRVSRDFIKRSINDLRANVEKERAEPPPRELSEKIAQFAEAARTLSGIENVPYLRDQLSMYLKEGHSESAMNEWIANLKTFVEMFDLWRKLREDDAHGLHARHRQQPELSCVVWAHDLIDRLAPMPLAKTGEPFLAKTGDSPFYEIVSLFWWTISGKKKSMKRICDLYIDYLREKNPDIKGTTILRLTIPSA
jgi:hypothetical protein